MTRKLWLYPLLIIKNSSEGANRGPFFCYLVPCGTNWRHIYGTTRRFQPFSAALESLPHGHRR